MTNDLAWDFFDDDDLALRARRAGFELAVAHDLFVHHFGSRTFAGTGIDTSSLMSENRARFLAKWGEGALSSGRVVALTPWAEAQPEGDVPRRPTVSLTMIVRDEEHNLPACLASAAGLFDQIVVVDTGSIDRTADIARSFGAQVFEFAWIDDFAAARNAALEHATGDYVFWLDADDRIEPPQRERFRALFHGLRHGDPAAFVVSCVCDHGPGTPGSTVVDHVRLFPRRDNIRWDYRVHEQILPALRRAGVPVRWSDAVIRHVGYTDPDVRRKKLDRDFRILEAELNVRPEEPFVLFNLGSIALERERPALRAGLPEAQPGWLGADRLDHAQAARPDCPVPLHARRPCRGPECLHSGPKADPDDAELLFREATARRLLGQDAEAEACWKRILTLRRPERFASVDSGIYGHLTRRNLAIMAEARGDREEARRQWSAVLAECPGDQQAIEAADTPRRLRTDLIQVPAITQSYVRRPTVRPVRPC